MTASLQDTLLTAFEARFGRAATHLARAPGRVNLIGEHTDYNDGFVLPCAINHDAWVAVAPRADDQVQVLALDVSEDPDSFTLAEDIPRREDADWANYVRGLLRQLRRNGPLPHGLDIAICGDVPQGAGLSSSAALELAVLRACALAWAGVPHIDALDGPAMALLAQKIENEFVGCQCGIMDQLVSAQGVDGHAVLIDCRSLQTEAVPLPAGVAVLIAHSRVSRGLVDSAYNERRQQCESVAAALGVKALRDLSLDELEAAATRLDPLALRRARHVVSENARVLAARHALARGDMAGLGRLMAESHASMRDDFEITVPAIDRLVAVLQAAIGQAGGARMTGGGFGGCVVALLPENQVPAALAALDAGYRSPEGLPAGVYLCRASAGARGVF